MLSRYSSAQNSSELRSMPGAVSNRLASIDTFRAVTMFLMIFVNDLILDKGVPAWLEHAEETQDRLGFADTIFPAFLFIVGLSIPLSITARSAKGLSRASTLMSIFRRSFALIAMGIFQVNYEEYITSGAVLPKYAWLLLITIAFFLIWLDYPPSVSQTLKRWLQGSGIMLLVLLACLYRGGTPEHPEWMETRWYGILGLIGWSYLLCSLIYLCAGDRLIVLSVVLIFFLGLSIADHAGWLKSLASLKKNVWIVSSGSLPAMTMAGVISLVLYKRCVKRGRSYLSRWILFLLALGLLIAGFALRPLGGISKIMDTPSWVLICTAISIGSFIILTYLVDSKGHEKWFQPLKPAGTSALTAYLLTYLHFALLQLSGRHLPDFLRTDIVGIGKSLIFAFVIVLLTGALEKKKIRLSI